MKPVSVPASDYGLSNRFHLNMLHNSSYTLVRLIDCDFLLPQDYVYLSHTQLQLSN
jgi:hypothetical protein